MLFAELNLGAILRRETGSAAPDCVRLLEGNPLIMKEMVKHVPNAGSYAAVTVLIDGRPNGVRRQRHWVESSCAEVHQR